MASNLQRQIRQLEELSRLQRRFVSDVSHELRTPITTVRMASDVIHDARPFLDPVTGRAAELLQKELDRFETLLADLLEISRFDAGAAVLEAEDVDLVDVARRVVDMTSALAAQRDTRVVLHDPGAPCVAEADVRRVERIVRNLVTNAIDHAESRDVEIFVGADRQSAAIAVRDHGVGLGPGESAMVFNRFWRADPARARTSGGTGLGLSISLEDTHLHDGWLQAWGRPGEGAQFRLTLPRLLGTQLGTRPCRWCPTTPGRPHERRGAGRVPARGARAAHRLRADAERGPGRRAPGLRHDRRRARHLLRPPAAAGRGLARRHRRRLPRGDEGHARSAPPSRGSSSRRRPPTRGCPSSRSSPTPSSARPWGRRRCVSRCRRSTATTPAGRGSAPRPRVRWSSGWRSRRASGASTSCRTPWSSRSRGSTTPTSACRSTSSTPPRRCWCPSPSSCRAGTSSPPRSYGGSRRCPTTPRPTWCRPTSRPGARRALRCRSAVRASRPWPSPATRTSSTTRRRSGCWPSWCGRCARSRGSGPWS